MKKHALLLGLPLIFFGCNEQNKETVAYTGIYQNQIDSMKNLLNERDASVNAFLASFNDIEKNLDSVAKRQTSIGFDVDNNRGDLRKDTRARINSQISAINELMDKNRMKIEELNSRLRKSGLKINEFQKIINTLNNQLTQKNSELETLNNRLLSLNEQVVQLQVGVDTLSSLNYEQSELITAQTASIHTAYYVVGKSQDLVKIKVIDKDGGLLGIGKTAKLSPELNPANFTRVDYTQTLSVAIYSKKAKIITTHPDGSYIIDKDENGKFTTLRIINPEKFWSASKYLVIINS